MSGSALARGRALLEVGRTAEAITVLVRALAASPESYWLLCMLSRAYNQAGQHREALRTAESAIATNPNGPDGFLRASFARHGLHAYGDAVETAREAVRLAPLAWCTHVRLAMALAHVQPVGDEAMKEATRAVELAPEEADAHFAVGFCASKLKRRSEAIAAYHRVLSLRPTHAAALNNIGLLQMKRGHLTAAAHDLRASIAADPNLETAKRNIDLLARLFLRRVYYAVFAIFLVMRIMSENRLPLMTFAVVGGGALVILLAAAVVMDRRLPQALQAYYRRLLIRDRRLGGRVALMALALALILSLGLPLGNPARLGIQWGVILCLIAGLWLDKAYSSRLVWRRSTMQPPKGSKRPH